jgi:hypothetical protein
MRPALDPAKLFLPAPPPGPAVSRHRVHSSHGASEPMEALYRAALGPVNAERYLSIFERFDATGCSTTHWNWTASLFTLNWMVFRKLWWPALLYVAAAEVLGLLLLGVGRGLLQWPRAVEGGVIGASVLLALAVPGLYGDALLHTELRQRITYALQTSHTIAQAQALLVQQASSLRRLKALVLANLMLAAAVAMACLLLWRPTGPAASAQPSLAELSQGPAQTAAEAVQAARPALSTPTTAAETAAAAIAPTFPVPENAVTAGADAPAQTPSAAPALEAATTTIPAPAVPPPTAESAPNTPTASPGSGARLQPPAAAQAAVTPTSGTTAVPTPATPGAASSAPPARNEAPATPRASPKPPQDLQKQAKTAAPATSARAAAATPTAPPSASATLVPALANSPVPDTTSTPTPATPTPANAPALIGSTPGYYINIGLFADETNARRAQARLLNEGISAFRQSIDSAQGPLTRVRAGPYASQAQAQAAAAAIRALQLEAVVFQQ